MLKIRRPLGRLIFNMGITIPGKTVFLIETAPWSRGGELTGAFWGNHFPLIEAETKWPSFFIRHAFSVISQQWVGAGHYFSPLKTRTCISGIFNTINDAMATQGARTFAVFAQVEWWLEHTGHGWLVKRQWEGSILGRVTRYEYQVLVSTSIPARLDTLVHWEPFSWFTSIGTSSDGVELDWRC